MNKSRDDLRVNLIWRELCIALFSALTGAAVTWFAMHSAERASVSGPDPAAGPVATGNWFYDRHNWPSAILAYQQAIAQGIDNPDVRTDLGNAYRFSGNPTLALEQYLIAQKQNPRHENSLFNQGALYAEDLKDPVRAVEIWKEFLRRFPQSPSGDTARKLVANAQGKSGSLPPETGEAVADYLKQLPASK